MKKYLISGMAAIVFCGAFTSCSHDLDNGGDSTKSTVEETYEKAFITHFGEPASTQTWGFAPSTAAKTRTLRHDLAGQSWIRNFAKAGTRAGTEVWDGGFITIAAGANPSEGESVNMYNGGTLVGKLYFGGTGYAAVADSKLSRYGCSAKIVRPYVIFKSLIVNQYYNTGGQFRIYNDYSEGDILCYDMTDNKFLDLQDKEEAYAGGVEGGHTYKIYFADNHAFPFYGIKYYQQGLTIDDDGVNPVLDGSNEQEEQQQASEQQEEQAEQQEEQQQEEQQQEEQQQEEQAEQGTGSTTTIFENDVTTCTVTDDYEAIFTKAYYEAIKDNMPELNQTTGERDYEFISSGPFEFSIIFSNTSSAVCDKVGYYYYSEEDGIENRTEVQFKDENTDPTTYFQYTKNSGEGDYYWETPGNQSGYQILDWGAQYVRAKVFTIDVPVGYRVGFWIENTCSNYPRFYSNQSLNQDGEHYSAVVDLDDDTFLVGLEDWLRAHGGDNDCNDIIISVNKGTTPPEIIIPSDDNDPQDETNEIVVIGEDLTIDDVKPDFDFNDVVFKVTWNKTQNKVTVKLLAAGGTLPLYVDGKEIHAEFAKVNPDKVIVTTTMINTAKNAHYAYKTPSFELENPSGTTIEKIAANIDVYAVKFGEPVRLAAPTGGVPSKIAVETKFLNAGWCDEREDIDEKFTDNGTPLFKNYVQGNLDDNWYTRIKTKNNQ